jgi:hypothetical protein
MDVVGDYRTLLDNRPQYKCMGAAQEAYTKSMEALNTLYNHLQESVHHFIVPQFKSQIKDMLTQNKETSRGRLATSPTRLMRENLSPKEKSSVVIDSYVKQQQNKPK